MLEDMNFPDVQAFKDYYKPMNQGLWKDLEQKKLTKQELVDSRFAIGFAHFGISVDGAEIALRYQDYISLQGQSFPGAEDLLARLEKAGYQLYGATNGVTAIQEGRLAHSTIASYFKEVFISEQLHTQKPEPAFFDKVGQLIPGFSKERDPHDRRFLDSRYRRRKCCGIDTVWYNPDHKENTSQVVPTYTVSNYQEIADLLIK